jgi:chromosome partitioning protein
MPIVVFNQKGGVGKSTITCNLAAISAAQGLRTLVIDLDPQGNSTSYSAGQHGQRRATHRGGFF